MRGKMIRRSAIFTYTDSACRAQISPDPVLSKFERTAKRNPSAYLPERSPIKLLKPASLPLPVSPKAVGGQRAAPVGFGLVP